MLSALYRMVTHLISTMTGKISTMIARYTDTHVSYP